MIVTLQRTKRSFDPAFESPDDFILRDVEEVPIEIVDQPLTDEVLQTEHDELVHAGNATLTWCGIRVNELRVIRVLERMADFVEVGTKHRQDVHLSPSEV